MKGMNDLLRQAQVMQSKLTKMQEELGERTVEACSGGGMVRVLCNGRQEIQSIHMEKEAVNPDDIEMLEDLTLTAVNEALRQARSMMEQEMNALTGGLKLPGMF
ncbi:MAG: YbaB/EbfC family nucleoid-associated protein [Deltaproteobacteria bacterium]|jgi:DNA-binding YbaB/EbfC family protein|nr:YbaB/EbfC family nucleoid-associated protein [Deltaproteobacteria bacterium]